jgi:ribosomal protein L11 methylase PrmA
MSLIQKILAAECLDPAGDVCFAVILQCRTDADVRFCTEAFAPLFGDNHVEVYEGGYRFMYIGQAGADPSPPLFILNSLLDAHQDGVELVETKVVNLGETTPVQHSFVFLQEGQPNDHTIILSPSYAFGSGEHPSTGLAIEFLEELAPLTGSVLDVGCGTGVLSFVALRLGAEKVLGLDIDEEGLRGAAINAKLNQVEEYVCFENKQPAEIDELYPLIIANLTCSVLKYLLPDLSDLAAPEGILIVSGLQGRQAVDAEAFLGTFGWRVTGRKFIGKWQALQAEKSK